jgi:hypothetical protein
MYAKKYTNKKGQQKIEILLTLDEAERVVNVSSAELIEEIRRAIEQTSERDFKPRGAPGRLEGLEILFDDLGSQPRSEDQADAEVREAGLGDGSDD